MTQNEISTNMGFGYTAQGAQTCRVCTGGMHSSGMRQIERQKGMKSDETGKRPCARAMASRGRSGGNNVTTISENVRAQCRSAHTPLNPAFHRTTPGRRSPSRCSEDNAGLITRQLQEPLERKQAVTETRPMLIATTA